MQELHQCNATKKSRTRNNPHPAHLFLLSYAQKLTAKGKLILALTGSFGFLLALYAGLLIMLTLASLCQNTCASTLTFEPLQSAFQGFVFADAYLGHLLSLPSLILRMATSYNSRQQL